ncbi:MAG: hypothetical protein IIB00_06160 [candidate division Zixibacteria bacterium]|nr:hypothetical protein [candidate division Zixibacteria bacterium]
MKSKLILGIGATLLVVMSLGQPAGAQDIDAILSAVEKIESNLKELIDQEAKARSKQFSEMKSIIAKNQKSSKGSATSGISEEQFLDVITDLSVLRLEIAELKEYFKDHGTQLTSLNAGVTPETDQRVKQIDARLATLTHDIQGLLDIQHTPAKAHQSDATHSKTTHSKTTHSKTTHSKTTINGKMYSHGFVNVSDNEGSHGEFALSRAYLTVRSKLSDRSNIRVTTDLKTIDDKYNIILKYAYIDWKPAFTGEGVEIRFGLQPTEYIDYMNKLWGRRYAAPTIGDLHHFLTSSDLGVSTKFSFGPESKFGFVRLSLLNGTSYTHVQELNSRKDFNIVTLLTPFKGSHNFKNSSFLMQYYTGTQNESLDDLVSIDNSVTPWDTTVTPVSGSDWKRQMVSVGGALVWDHTLDFGVDMNFLTLGKGVEKSAVKKRGLSVFGALYLYKFSQSPFVKKLGIIGRIDFYDPDRSKANNSEILSVIGIESKPMYSLKVALNYRTTSFSDDTEDSQSTLFLNTLFKF